MPPKNNKKKCGVCCWERNNPHRCGVCCYCGSSLVSPQPEVVNFIHVGDETHCTLCHKDFTGDSKYHGCYDFSNPANQKAYHDQTPCTEKCGKWFVGASEKERGWEAELDILVRKEIYPMLEKFRELYPSVNVGFDGDELDAKKRQKIVEFVEDQTVAMHAKYHSFIRSLLSQERERVRGEVQKMKLPENKGHYGPNDSMHIQHNIGYNTALRDILESLNQK